jgi:glycosyltransferase involved in cell wall biosynthesis
MYFGGLLIRLDIILPAYNPLPGWEDVVIHRFKSLQHQLSGLELGLIIVNDGSGTIDIANSSSQLTESIPGVELISYPENKGKGYALRVGVQASQADFVVYTDIDWPYQEKSIIELIRCLENGADVVIGIRDEAYYSQLPPARRRISKLLRKINSLIFRLRVDDTQAGLKGFRKHVKETFLATTIKRYLFDLEFLYLLSAQKNVKVEGIPIRLRPGVSFSKMNRKILFREGKNFLKIWFKSK